MKGATTTSTNIRRNRRKEEDENKTNVEPVCAYGSMIVDV